MKLKSLVTGLFLLTIVGNVQAQSTAGSEVVSQGSAMVVSGSVTSLAGSTQVIVESITYVGQSAVITLKSLPELSTATIRVSAAGLGASAVTAGQSIQLVTHSTGTLLMRAGEILAMIPNEMGKALLYQSIH